MVRKESRQNTECVCVCMCETDIWRERIAIWCGFHGWEMARAKSVCDAICSLRCESITETMGNIAREYSKRIPRWCNIIHRLFERLDYSPFHNILVPEKARIESIYENSGHKMTFSCVVLMKLTNTCFHRRLLSRIRTLQFHTSKQ